MRLRFVLILSAALLSLPAYAAPVDNLTITGHDSSNTPFSLAFQLPSSYPAPSIPGGQTIFTAVPILVDGFNETGTITIDNTQFFLINLTGPGSDNFAINTTLPFETLANGTDTFSLFSTDQAATYINCSVRLVTPRLVTPRPANAVLAFLQIPTFSYSCPALSNLAISTSALTATTPEPSSFALLLLGSLALAGIVCTRTLRTAA